MIYSPIIQQIIIDLIKAKNPVPKQFRDYNPHGKYRGEKGAPFDDIREKQSAVVNTPSKLSLTPDEVPSVDINTYDNDAIYAININLDGGGSLGHSGADNYLEIYKSFSNGIKLPDGVPVPILYPRYDDYYGYHQDLLFKQVKTLTDSKVGDVLKIRGIHESTLKEGISKDPINKLNEKLTSKWLNDTVREADTIIGDHKPLVPIHVSILTKDTSIVRISPFDNKMYISPSDSPYQVRSKDMKDGELYIVLEPIPPTVKPRKDVISEKPIRSTHISDIIEHYTEKKCRFGKGNLYLPYNVHPLFKKGSPQSNAMAAWCSAEDFKRITKYANGDDSEGLSSAYGHLEQGGKNGGEITMIPEGMPIKEVVKNLDEYIDTFPAPPEGISLYRGVGSAMADHLVGNCKIGDTIFSKTYAAFAYDANNAITYAKRTSLPDEDCQVMIRLVTEKDDKCALGNPGDSEVLYPRNLTFEITDISYGLRPQAYGIATGETEQMHNPTIDKILIYDVKIKR